MPDDHIREAAIAILKKDQELADYIVKVYLKKNNDLMKKSTTPNRRKVLRRKDCNGCYTLHRNIEEKIGGPIGLAFGLFFAHTIPFFH